MLKGLVLHVQMNLVINLGLSGNHPDRIKAGCLYILEKECMQNGHVFVHAEDLLVKVQKLIRRKDNEIKLNYQDITTGIIEA